MPLAIPAIIGASVVGGALGSKSKQTSQSSSQYNNTSTTNPVLNPQQQSLYGALTSQAMQRLSGTTPGLAGYQAQGLSNINASSNAVQQAIQSRLAAQGLLNSPVAATAATQQELARAGQAAQFNNSLPLLQNQLQVQNLGIGQDILHAVPFGTTGTSSGTQSGTNTTTGTYGGGVGGAFSGLGGALGFLYGQGAFGQNGPTSLPPVNLSNTSIPAGIPGAPPVNWGGLMPNQGPLGPNANNVDWASLLGKAGFF